MEAPMPVVHSRQKNTIRVRRSRKLTGRRVEAREGLADSSGASLIYAGYPYDPYV